jgi:hypothetical protein
MKTVLSHLKTPAWDSIKKAGDMYATVNFSSLYMHSYNRFYILLDCLSTPAVVKTRDQFSYELIEGHTQLLFHATPHLTYHVASKEPRLSSKNETVTPSASKAGEA